MCVPACLSVSSRVGKLETRDLLAAANRSRVCIYERPCKIFLTSSLIAVQNLAVVYRTVCKHVGPINFRHWGPPWDGDVADP